tara:strand:- start:719 stop:1042 length:324 start_codon:yes stop_codon:yes gene_type:complete
MAFNGSQHFRIARPIIQPGSVNEESTAVHKTLTVKSSTYQFLTNTTGAVTLDCILPEPIDGLHFFIKNEGASNNFVILDDGSTIETLTPGDTALVVGTPTKYKSMKF